MRRTFSLTAALALALGPTAAGAQLINIGPGAFTPAAPTITFSEVPLGITNPVYNFTGLAGIGDLTVSFAPSFVGQTITTNSFGVKTLSGAPTGSLTLNTTTADRVFITNDVANPTAPVLSGTPTFNGPVSVFFSQALAAVALDGGFFDAINGTTIQAFGLDGSVLGSITNSQGGIETYGLADASGANVIGGISFYITGNEPAGFAIDNLRFGSAQVLEPGVVTTPEPGSLALLATGLVGLAAAARRRRTR